MLPASWKILLTGVTSIHGWPIYKTLLDQVGPDRLLAIRSPKMTVPAGGNVRSLCVTDTPALERIRDEFSPTHVIHAAGVCDLDVCEERPEWARALNVTGAASVARAFLGAYLMHLSADLVFSGNAPPGGGYREHDVPDPVSVAGKTFAEAEAIFAAYPRTCIVRLGLPIGRSITRDKGAFDFVDSRLRRGLPITLFYDELRSCIAVETIASVVVALLAREETGPFHCGGDVPKSLHEVGKMVLAAGDYPPHLLTTMSRFEEKNGPPRMGDVSLDSAKVKALLGIGELV